VQVGLRYTQGMTEQLTEAPVDDLSDDQDPGPSGCVVEVQTDAGPAMQRVCVDGPVFDGRKIFG